VQKLLSSSLLSKNFKDKIYRIITLPVVLYGYETWLLTLREECRLSVFENRVMRRIFGHRRGEVTGEWRKLSNAELNDLYCSPNIVRVIKSRKIKWEGGGIHSEPSGRVPNGTEHKTKDPQHTIRHQMFGRTKPSDERAPWRMSIGCT